MVIKDLLSSVSEEVGERKVMTCTLVTVAAIGLWMLLAHSCGSSANPPTLGKQVLICTSCNQRAEIEIDMAFAKDKATTCPHCGKEAAWLRASCPHCRQDFPYGQLREQGSDRAIWKCPKCGTRILNPAKGKAKKR